MRHLWSLLAGVVAAPLTWLFLATGQYRSQRAVARFDEAGQFDTVDLVGPVFFLAVAGILLGVIGTLRWSPAGSMAAGVLLVIPTVLMFINPFRTMEGFFRTEGGGPRRWLGQDLQPWLPVENGTLLVLGSLLLIAVFSVQRWRQWPVTPAPLPPATDSEVVAGISSISTLGEQKPSGPEQQDPAPGEGEPQEAEPGEAEPREAEPARNTMTDDEILAAAAAYESTETRPSAGRPPDTSPTPEEDENRPSPPAGSSGA